MKLFLFSSFLFLFTFLPGIAQEPVVTAKNVPDITVKILEKLLPEQPVGIGKPYDDREYWKAFHALVPDWKKHAASIRNRTERYLSSESGKEKSGAPWSPTAAGDILKRLLAAEGLDPTETGMQRILLLTEKLASAKSWSENGSEKSPPSENCMLRTSTIGYYLAETLYLCGDRIPAELRKKVIQEIEKRCIAPYRRSLASGKPECWWMTCDYNWGIVCNANILFCVNTVVKDRAERAMLSAPIMRNCARYIAGYPEDGYCSEGNGYWIYGMTHYLEYAEYFYRLTHGKIDLFNGRPELDAAKRYQWNLVLDQDVYPWYADCYTHVKGSDYSPLLYLRGKCPEFYGEALRIRKNYPAWEVRSMLMNRDAVLALPDRDVHVKRPVFHHFEHGGVITSRAGEEDPSGFSLSLKAGHNTEYHNHNDVGTFVVAIHGKSVLLDPGYPVVTATTFTGRRYESDGNNSYGHSVPVVNGMLQDYEKGGGKVKRCNLEYGRYYGKIIQVRNTPDQMRAVLDLKKAYPDNSGLEFLTRTFVHDRKTRTITITDHAKFKQKSSFGSALISDGAFRPSGTNRFLAGKDSRQLEIIIESEKPLNFRQEKLKAKFHKMSPVRLGFDVGEKSSEFKITTTIRPYSSFKNQQKETLKH